MRMAAGWLAGSGGTRPALMDGARWRTPRHAWARQHCACACVRNHACACTCVRAKLQETHWSLVAHLPDLKHCLGVGTRPCLSCTVRAACRSLRQVGSGRAAERVGMAWASRASQQWRRCAFHTYPVATCMHAYLHACMSGRVVRMARGPLPTTCVSRSCCGPCCGRPLHALAASPANMALDTACAASACRTGSSGSNSRSAWISLQASPHLECSRRY